MNGAGQHGGPQDGPDSQKGTVASPGASANRVATGIQGIQSTNKEMETSRTAVDNAQLLAESDKAGEALSDSQAQLQQTMKAGRVFTCEWEPETDALYRSPNCAAILGIDPATCTRDTGENVFRRIHEDDKASLSEMVRGLTPEAPTYEVRYRFARDDGRCVWIEESGQAKFDNAGNMVRLQGICSDITERMEAMAREKEAAARVAAGESAIEIVDTMGEGVMLFRLDGTVMAVNPSVETLTALGRDEMVGQNLRTLLPRFMEGHDLAAMTHALDAAMQGRVSKLKPVVLQRETMAPVTVSPSLAFIRSPEGTPVRAVLTLKDVTELYQQSELLNQIFDSTHMQIICLDNQLKVVRVNRAYADYYHQDSEFFCGKNYLELCSDQDIRTALRRTLQTDEIFSAFAHPSASADHAGKTTYWDYSLRPMHDKNGKRDGVLLCLADVTERVQARRQLVESELKYRELVENANSIIIRITPEHDITFFNKYAQTFFGYTSDEILGKNVVGTIAPPVDSDGRDMQEMLREITAHPEIYGSNENENMCKDGRRVWIHWSNRALRDELGAVKEILCVGSDITEQRRLTKLADTYRRRLRALAGRLTAKEEQERRRVATQIHDTVVQTLSLATIRLGGVNAAVEQAGLSGPRKRIEGVRRLLDQGTAECRGLMEGLMPSLLYELGLAAAIKDFAEKQAKTDGTPIVVEADDPMDSLDEALRSLLFQCARELIMNALKYAGHCEIRVSLSSDANDIQLRVQDTGRGFDPADLDGQSYDENGGFGLFNIEERLDSLGGRLAIDSAPGRGTTATVQVPLVANPTRKHV